MISRQMDDETNTSPRAFAARLRTAMLARGYRSDGARSGVDVRALADAVGTSYEMARRYAEGLAVPRPEKLDAIARWLGTSAAALAWGAEQPAAVNLELLEKCLSAIAEAQARVGLTLPTERAARLVALLYHEAAAGRFPAPTAVDLLIRA